MQMRETMLGLVVLGAVMGCNPMDYMACRDELTSTQKVLVEMDDQKLDDVEGALSSVKKTLSICENVAGSENVAKLRDAQQKLEKQQAGLIARGTPRPRPKISEAELATLTRNGDDGCPRGQSYEHPQNKAMIRCTGPQLVEMNWAQAMYHFVEKQGYSQHPDGGTVRFEVGSEVYQFDFAEPESKQPVRCLTMVGKPHISWQELVARATGVQPRKLKLSKPVLSSKGPLALIVEGAEDQFVVKLGKCAPTPGQKPYEEPKK